MTSVIDSAIFGNILSTRASAAIWSDTTRTQYYLLFEASLAKVQAAQDIIPQDASDLIVEHCKLNQIDFDELRRQTELIGYPVLPVVQQLVRKVNRVKPGLGEWTHWGATTQDVTDTATILQLRDTLDLVEESLDAISKALRKLCEAHKATPMAARSNLQQAVPMTFGFKMARLLATFVRHQHRLEETRKRLLVVEFGGAAGTLATLDAEKALECQFALARELGLGVPEIAWHTERDRIAEVGSLFALITGTCSKFAFDLKLMMQNEVGEASELYIPHRGSSSTMPQKRNPIGAAYITAASATVKQLSGALFDAMVADHERSTGPWEIEWIVLPQICTLTHSALRHTQDILEGIEVNLGAMQKNLEISKGGVVSEAVMMGLGKNLGRQKAHDLIYDLCRRAQVEDRPLVDLLDESAEVPLPRGDLERLCDPGNYLGLSIDMTERVLATTPYQPLT